MRLPWGKLWLCWYLLPYSYPHLSLIFDRNSKKIFILYINESIILLLNSRAILWAKNEVNLIFNIYGIRLTSTFYQFSLYNMFNVSCCSRRAQKLLIFCQRSIKRRYSKNKIVHWGRPSGEKFIFNIRIFLDFGPYQLSAYLENASKVCGNISISLKNP